ncbi:MAG: T9SS type A sorting domain-containing protein [Bacteroidetes bacterium]|nr:T9SS type A sorting domain-containing protein [Bacteroidota bacterium]
MILIKKITLSTAVFALGGLSVNAQIMVKDIYTGTGDSYPSFLTNINGTLYFAADNGTNGKELWKSDGTDIGTVMVKDIYPGVTSAMSTMTSPYFTNVNGTLFFTANDGTNGYELWKSDGTDVGTVIVKDINLTGSSNSAYLTNVNGVLFFTANDSTNGYELWKSDGTDAGTVIVKDINPTGSSNPAYLTNVNGVLFFTSNDSTNGYELWKSDGTNAGTVMVKDIYPGASSSMPITAPTFAFPYFTNSNGILYFFADNGTNGDELWKSDGSTAGTSMVKDINPAGSSEHFDLINANGTLYVGAYDGTNGVELWKSDGTDAGTVIVKDINPAGSSNPAYLTNVNGTVYFSAYDGSWNGIELWKSDGTATGTVMVKDVFPGYNNSYPSDLTNSNGILYFIAYNGTNGWELWKSDGTAVGTVMEKDIWPGLSGSFDLSPSYLTDVNGTLYFAASQGTNGVELWRNNITTDIFSLVINDNPIIYPNPSNGKFTATIDSGSINQIAVYNVIGESVYFQKAGTSSQSETLNIDLGTDFPAGIYFLQVNIGEQTINKKLVVENK